MKPSKSNIQSEILCQIFYGLANFWQRSHSRSAEEQTLYVHKGCLTLKQQVLVLFLESVFHSICSKPLSIDYLQLVTVESRDITSLVNFEIICMLKSVCVLLYCLSFDPSHSLYKIYELTIQIFNNPKNTFFHNFSVRLEKCEYFSSRSLASTPSIFVILYHHMGLLYKFFCHEMCFSCIIFLWIIYCW